MSTTSSSVRIHTLERFASNWDFATVLAAVMHVTHQTKDQLRQNLAPLPADLFDLKLKLVQWLVTTYGPEAVDQVEQLIRDESDLGVALGEAGYTTEQLEQDLQSIVDVNSVPRVVQQVFEYIHATDDRSRELLIEQWRHNSNFLARSIILMRIQQYLNETYS